MVVDENGRSALHFAAALGVVDAVKLLVEASADINLQDREGYTPLHMAAGYMHTSSMTTLLESGANPQLRDNTGKDCVQLVDNLRNTMPLNASSVTRRIALEQVSGLLAESVYEELPPSRILNTRRVETKNKRKRLSAKGEEEEYEEIINSVEYLVQFPGGMDDQWVDEKDMAQDVLEDYKEGLEYATAVDIVDFVQVGTARRFKVQWSDGYPTSWEPEEYLPPDLITLFQQQKPELFQQRVLASETASAVPSSWTEELEGFAAAETAAAESAAGASRGETSEAFGGGGGVYRTQYAPMQIKVAAAAAAPSSPLPPSA